MITTTTEHTRPIKFNFLRRGDMKRKLIFAKIQIYMHILGPENASFEADPVTIA